MVDFDAASPLYVLALELSDALSLHPVAPGASWYVGPAVSNATGKDEFVVQSLVPSADYPGEFEDTHGLFVVASTVSEMVPVVRAFYGV
jgi:hypothetical protein